MVFSREESPYVSHDVIKVMGHAGVCCPCIPKIKMAARRGLPMSEATARKKKRIEYVVHFGRTMTSEPNYWNVLFVVFH